MSRSDRSLFLSGCAALTAAIVLETFKKDDGTITTCNPDDSGNMLR